MVNREMTKYLDRICSSLEKLEKLADEPFVEIEPVPPSCPHCSVIDPEVVTSEDGGGTGKLSSFILIGICKNCGNKLFGVVNHWVVHTKQSEARDNINQIKERLGYGNNGRA